MTRIKVTGRVPAPPAAVFERLADLDAHDGLAAPHIRVLDLHGPRGRRTGGLVELCGPLGVRLRARTRVRSAEFPRELGGTLDTASATRATLHWRLAPEPGRTAVTAELCVDPAPAHRVLLALGGRVWLRRRLATAIDRLMVSSGSGPCRSSARGPARARRSRAA